MESAAGPTAEGVLDASAHAIPPGANPRKIATTDARPNVTETEDRLRAPARTGGRTPTIRGAQGSIRSRADELRPGTRAGRQQVSRGDDDMISTTPEEANGCIMGCFRANRPDRRILATVDGRCPERNSRRAGRWFEHGHGAGDQRRDPGMPIRGGEGPARRRSRGSRGPRFTSTNQSSRRSTNSLSGRSLRGSPAQGDTPGGPTRSIEWTPRILPSLRPRPRPPRQAKPRGGFSARWTG